MRNLSTPAIVLSLISTTTAWAQDAVDTIAAPAPAGPQTSEAVTDQQAGGLLKNDVLTFKPAVGVVSYNDATETGANRFAVGMLIDASFTPAFTEDMRWLYLGLTTGGIFSHLGSASSNFFGTSPSTVTSPTGANMLLVPLNLEIGWNALQANARIAIHGGGNVVYRSDGRSMNLGNTTNVEGSVWRIYPNVGADLDVALSKVVTISFRPDFTLTPGNSIFTGTLSTGFSLS